jgi:NADPH:quinone reductase-like Zn-dependent oxidoreductase
LKRSFDAVKPGGTIVSIKGDAPDGLAAERSVAFHSFFMEPDGEQLAEIATLITNGTIHPVLDRTFPLDDVVAAYDYARSGSSNGKVAVVVR